MRIERFQVQGGCHFDAIPQRMRTKELESWLTSHV